MKAISCVLTSCESIERASPAPESTAASADPKFTLVQTTCSQIQRIATCWHTIAYSLWSSLHKKIQSGHPVDTFLYKNVSECSSLTGALQNIAVKYSIAYICKQGNQTRGFVVASIKGDNLKIERLISHPSRFTPSGVRGAGSFLLHMMEKVACALNLSAIKLAPVASSVDFYTRQGYAVLNKHRPNTYWKIIECLSPVAPDPVLYNPKPYEAHKPTMVLEQDITEEMYHNLAERIDNYRPIETIKNKFYDDIESLQLVAVFDEPTKRGSLISEALEALFLLNVSDPNVLKVEVAADSTKGSHATDKALEFVTTYAAECGRRLECDLLLLPCSKRKRSEAATTTKRER